METAATTMNNLTSKEAARGSTTTVTLTETRRKSVRVHLSCELRYGLGLRVTTLLSLPAFRQAAQLESQSQDMFFYCGSSILPPKEKKKLLHHCLPARCHLHTHTEGHKPPSYLKSFLNWATRPVTSQKTCQLLGVSFHGICEKVS